MPVKSEWDLDPGSLQTLQFDSNVLNISNEDNAAEFYGACPLGISPPGTVPNDDIWKKFGLGDDFYDDIDFGICEDFATAATTWMNPTYMKTTRGEIMNHDCMWAGHCVSDKHDRKVENKTNWTAFVPIKKPLTTPTVTPKPEEPKVIAVTTPDGTMTPDGGKICVKKNAVVAPTHARSLLLPTRIINNNQTTKTPMQKTNNNNNNMSISNISANRCNSRSKTLDSRGESPRPETPQSLSDSEDLDIDLMDLPTVEDVVDLYGADMADMYNDIVKDIGGLSDFSDDVDFYSDESDSSVSKCSSPSKVTAVSPSKVTGFKVVSRTNVNPVSNGNSNTNISNSNSNSNNPVTVKQEVPISRHYTTNSYFSDHCYHLSKNARMDHLGVQTPSDSEEEIDVETVYGDSKKPNSRSSSTGGVLPTNPSFSDRQQLQLTVASAIHNKKEVKKASARTSSVPNRYDLDERTLKPNKIVACKRGKNSVKNGELRRTNKRSAQFDDYEYLTTKSVKRKKSQYQRHFKSGKSKKSKTRRNQSRTSGGSSESEEDSSQKRSMHNSMERQRRIDLRNAFEELRKLVPKTADNEKAAKVVILSFGAQHCQELAQKEADYQRKAADLRRQQEMLRAKLSHLRRYIFKMRE